MADSTYRFERLRDDNMEDLQFLFREVLGRRFPISYLQQKYNTSFTGVRHLTHIAYHRSQPVSFYGVVPTFFSWNNNRYLAAQTCDYLTLRSHQRKGLHRQLSDRAFELMRHHGVTIAFALMSDDSLASGKKLGWNLLGRMQAFVIPCVTLPVAKAVRKLRFANTLFDSFTHRVFREHTIPSEDYRNSLIEEGWLGVEYSPDFFAYKTFTNNFHIKLDGVTAWIKADRNLLVGDLNFKTDQALEQAIVRLKRFAALSGFTEIIIQASSETRLLAHLESRYSSHPSWTIGYIDLGSGLPTEKLRCNFGDFDTF
ncbi:MAG: hypothetical protein DRJ65_22005 [Acidobacteria bacterium]|nr:MAG: hypothetical protein DRJ65_22005 [Acidobacteriota bacterium]